MHCEWNHRRIGSGSDSDRIQLEWTLTFLRTAFYTHFKEAESNFAKHISLYWNIQGFIHSVFTFLESDIHHGQQLPNIKIKVAKAKAIHDLLLQNCDTNQ